MRIVTVALLILCAASGSAIDCTIDPATGLPPTPIVINFAKDPYRLTGAESPVTFDFYANGQPLRMGWTAAEADVAFLCLFARPMGRKVRAPEIGRTSATVSSCSKSQSRRSASSLGERFLISSSIA
jgi:hypothetical protein